MAARMLAKQAMLSKYYMWIIIFVSVLFGHALCRYAEKDNCQLVTVSTCADHFNYNYTLYPNLLQHQRQDEAESDLRQYELLVQSDCSPNLRFFLCVLFVPVCTVLSRPLPPCRHLCNEVRSGCETLLNRYGFKWPEPFYCSKFPHPQTDICVGNPNTEKKTIKEPRSAIVRNNKDGIIDLQEGQKTTIECKEKNTTIHIRKVRHFNRSGCRAKISRNALAKICNGKIACTFILNAITLGGHCHGRVGRSRIKYKCTKGGIRNLSATLGNKLSLGCKGKREIRVIKASFGDKQCRTPHAHCVLSQVCNGNKTCEIVAEKSQFDSSCSNQNIKLELQYECIRRPDEPIKTSSIVGEKILVIPPCPSQKKLSIIHAKYGENGRCQMYCVVFALCNGKSSCVIPNMAQFRRSCPGASRKLEVRYQCI